MGLVVNIYSHCAEIKIKPGDKEMLRIMEYYARKWDCYQWINKGGKVEKEFQARYLCVAGDRLTYRMHKNQYLHDFLKYYKEKSQTSIEEHVVPFHETKECHFELQEGWELKPAQVEAYAYIIKEKPIYKMLGSQPGAGKSFMSMKSMCHFGTRVLMIFRPQYKTNWIKNFVKTFVEDEDDYVYVEGASQLKKLLKLDKNSLKAKIVIISNSTFRSFISLYEKMGDRDFAKLGFACRPQDIWEKLGIGYRIIDEVHLDFHFNFKLDCYTHVEHSLSMSATLTTRNMFIAGMHNVCYPMLDRFIPTNYNKYIMATAIFYKFKKPQLIRTSERGSNRYSHNALEESIMRHHPTKMNYFALIDRVMRITFMRKYKPGYKLLIFVFKVNLAIELRKYLAEKYPQFRVGTYIEQDNFENVSDYDITISNIIKAGAAQDIKGLYQVMQTINVDSEATNEQALGRLREREDKEKPWFTYFICDDFDAHKRYYDNKIPLLEKVCISRNEIYIDHMV